MPPVRCTAALLAAASLVACGAGGGSAPASEPVIAGHAPAAAPAGPAPAITFRDGRFDTSQLPAIARDGGAVVVPIDEGDGGRGYPNLRLEVRDRADRVADQLQVMASAEFEQLVPDGAHASAALERRIADANRWLADLHARHDLVAMHERDHELGMKVTFDGHTLRVKARQRFGDYKTLTKVDGTSWLAVPRQTCAGCPPCENPARLDGTYEADEVDRVIVVRIRYEGTDLCWEPGDQLHVIAW